MLSQDIWYSRGKPGRRELRSDLSTQLDGGYWSLGDRGYSPFQGGTNVFSFADSLDMVRGNHDINVGLALRANQMNVLAEGFAGRLLDLHRQPGALNLRPIFMLGLPSLAIHDQTFNGNVTGRRWKLIPALCARRLARLARI